MQKLDVTQLQSRFVVINFSLLFLYFFFAFSLLFLCAFFANFLRAYDGHQALVTFCLWFRGMT